MGGVGVPGAGAVSAAGGSDSCGGASTFGISNDSLSMSGLALVAGLGTIIDFGFLLNRPT